MLAYDPPRRIVLAWQLSHEFAYDPASQTELDVRFISESPARTRVELEHRRFEAYGARSREQRKLYEGDHAWAFILRCYAGTAPGISRP